MTVAEEMADTYLKLHQVYQEEVNQTKALKEQEKNKKEAAKLVAKSMQMMYRWFCLSTFVDRFDMVKDGTVFLNWLHEITGENVII